MRTVHAEQNAICQAARLGISLQGATIYCRMTPCRTCAMLIINCGIERVVCERKYHDGQESEEKSAYTLTDRATYLTQTQKGLKLKILVEGDKGLLNPYGVIAVNPEKSPKIQADLANQFIDWLISLPTQEKIAAYKKADYGMSVIMPSSNLWRAAHP